jgi:hypothetical protein
MCIDTVIFKRGAVLYMDHEHILVCNGTNSGTGLANLTAREKISSARGIH